MADLKDRAQAELARSLIELGMYRHYKNSLYVVFSTSVDEATLDPLVHYYSVAKKTRWTRPLKNFRESVSVDGKDVARFELVSVASVTDLVTACFDGLEQLAVRAAEAGRLALLIIIHDVGASLDASDEWLRHPETDVLFTREELMKVRAKAMEFLGRLERRVVK